MAAARVAGTSRWRSGGDCTAAHRLARTTGTSVSSAAGVIDTGRRLESVPEVAAAARRGELSAAQTAVIADAATADPSRASSLAELRDECAANKAAARPDAEARRRVIHQRRCLRTDTDSEGAWNLRVRNNPEVGAEILAALGLVGFGPVAVSAIRDLIDTDNPSWPQW